MSLLYSKNRIAQKMHTAYSKANETLVNQFQQYLHVNNIHEQVIFIYETLLTCTNIWNMLNTINDTNKQIISIYMYVCIYTKQNRNFIIKY